jgi:hypothetical protein
MKMKKKLIKIGSIVPLSIFLFCMSSSITQALNYTPGVQVGDVLVFEQSYPWGAYDVTHTITAINDSTTGTWINGTINDGYEDYPLGFLTNYTLYPQYLIASYVISPYRKSIIRTPILRRGCCP